MDQLAEYSWSHFCYSPLITRGSAGRVQLVTLLLLSTHHPWISWQSTAGHTSVTLHSSPVDQLAEYSWSDFCYSPLITRGSAGRVQLVTLRPFSWQSTLTLITRGSAGRAQPLLLLSTHHPWVSWQSTAGQTSHSPLITRGSAYFSHSVNLHHYPWISWQSTSGHTSWISYSPLHHPWISWQSTAGLLLLSTHTRGSALVTLLLLRSDLLLSTHHPWISWQSTAGHTFVTLHSSDQLAEYSWSHFC